MKTAAIIIIDIMAAMLAMAGLVMLVGEPSDSTWSTFWTCMAWKPVGVAALVAAYRLEKTGRWLTIKAIRASRRS